jgi:Tfp pilus assembly protein PilF
MQKKNRRFFWKSSPVLLAASYVLFSFCSAQAQFGNPLQACLLYANQGDFQNAIRECKRAVQHNPYSAAAYTNLGVAYIQVGKNNNALDALKRGAQLAPHDPMAQYNLAVVYSLINQNDRSLEALDRALRNGFNNADALRFDRDLDNVRGEPEFRTILERHKFFIQ